MMMYDPACGSLPLMPRSGGQTKVFVGSLPDNIKEDEVRTALGKVGVINDVVLLSKPAGGTGGCGFVFFQDEASAVRAIESMNGIYKMREDDEKPITLEISKPAAPTIPQPGPPMPPITGLQDPFIPYNPMAPMDPLQQGIMPPMPMPDQFNFPQNPMPPMMDPMAQVNPAGGGFTDPAPGASTFPELEPLSNPYANAQPYSDYPGFGQEQQFQQQPPPMFQDSWGGGGGGGKGKGGGGGFKGKDRGGGGKGKGGYGKNSWGGDGPCMDEDNTCLFVGNLPSSVDEYSVQEIFQQYGFVESVKLLQGKSHSGQACAFVTFSRREEAQFAINFLDNKYEFQPNSGIGMITVMFSRQKSKRKGGPY